MDVDAYMAERIPRIDAALEARFDAGVDWPPSLREAMRHLLFPGGKRLRPVFSLAAAEAIGRPPECALPVAVAVELIHTYSLVHDDLPCMDDDDERRGRPTVHRAHGEAMAVLAGDALLTEAFAALADEGAAPAEARDRLRALELVARAAGAGGLVGGQVDDLAFEASGAAGTDQEWLASIHARKTGALFEAAIVGGAVRAGADDVQQDALGRFAREIGLAFQIADDLLDADRDEATSILRVEEAGAARGSASRLRDLALSRIEGWGERAEPLRELARYAVRRDR